MFQKVENEMELELQHMICILLVLYCQVNDISSKQIWYGLAPNSYMYIYTLPKQIKGRYLHLPKTLSFLNPYSLYIGEGFQSLTYLENISRGNCIPKISCFRSGCGILLWHLVNTQFFNKHNEKEIKTTPLHFKYFHVFSTVRCSV